MKQAQCVVAVEVYDSELRGTFAAGQIIEGDRAVLALARYPEYFAPVERPNTEGDK